MTKRKTGYSSLNAENRGVTIDVMFAYVHKKINNLLCFCEHFFYLFYDLNLNTQGFVYSEFVKYQLGLHRNVQGFAKCKVYLSAIHLFYIQIYPGFLPISK